MVGLFEALFGVAGFGLIAVVVFRIGRAAPRMEPASLLEWRAESTTREMPGTKYVAPRTGDELRVTAETDGLTSEEGHQRLGRASRGGR